ncbi:unnamed protein product, partial [Discosporangium mesarthrocarpum]
MFTRFPRLLGPRVLVRSRPASSETRRCGCGGKATGTRRCISRPSSTFVSRHHVLPTTDVLAFLDQRGMAYKVVAGEVVVKDCPFCHGTGGKLSNMWKLYIGLNKGGAWMCHRCASSGSWYDLKRLATPNGSHIPTAEGATIPPPPRPANSNPNGGSGELEGRSLSRKSGGPQRSLSKAERRHGDGKPLPYQDRVHFFPTNLMHNPRYRHVKSYLTGREPGQRGISPEVLIKYGVGCASYMFPGDEGYVEADSITFPWVVRKGDLSPDHEDYRDLDFTDHAASERVPGRPVDALVVRVKARAMKDKRWQKLDPPGGRWGLFGLHTIPQDATEVVVTEGEFDAMAVYQATGRPAVSLPNGASSLPLGVLPLLERFERVYLWMDHDGPGQAGLDRFVRKLGARRCLVVRPSSNDPNPAKDANEALLMGKDLQELLDEAAVMPHEDIQTFQDLRQDILHQIKAGLHPCSLRGKGETLTLTLTLPQNPKEYTGAPLRSFPTLTGIIKGLRKGELTVLTGPTGSGKTTVLSQLSLDLAEAGLNTLWGSFEIKNTRLLQKMLQQFARRPLEDLISSGSAEALNAVADRFQNLPLSFMRFHGGTDVDCVLDAMDHAVYAKDVQHIILDNLQFMLTRS